MAVAAGMLLPFAMSAPARAQAPSGFERYVPHPTVESWVKPGYTAQMQIGDWGEHIVRNTYRLHDAAWQVVPGNLRNNRNGLDVLAVRRDASGQITRIEFGEIKTRAQLSASDVKDAAAQLTDEAIEKNIKLLGKSDPKLAEEISQFMKKSPDLCKRVIVGVDGATGKMRWYGRHGNEFVGEHDYNISRDFKRAAARTNDRAVRFMAHRMVDEEAKVMANCRTGSNIRPLGERIPGRFPATVEEAGAIASRSAGKGAGVAGKLTGSAPVNGVAGKLTGSASAGKAAVKNWAVVRKEAEKAMPTLFKLARKAGPVIKWAGPGLKVIGHVAGPVDAAYTVITAVNEADAIGREYDKGNITIAQREVAQVKVFTGASGGAVGALAMGYVGAAIGTAIFPGPGTAIGGIGGAFIGAIAGRQGGVNVADALGGATYVVTQPIRDCYTETGVVIYQTWSFICDRPRRPMDCLPSWPY